VFSALERATIAHILREFPEAVQDLEASLRAVLERLVPSCQGHLLSEADVQYLLTGLADRVVTRTIQGEPEVLRATVMDLVARHLLAGMRSDFQRRVLAQDKS
jgi:hypothetical protein